MIFPITNLSLSTAFQHVFSKNLAKTSTLPEKEKSILHWVKNSVVTYQTGVTGRGSRAKNSYSFSFVDKYRVEEGRSCSQHKFMSKKGDVAGNKHNICVHLRFPQPTNVFLEDAALYLDWWRHWFGRAIWRLHNINMGMIRASRKELWIGNDEAEGTRNPSTKMWRPL